MKQLVLSVLVFIQPFLPVARAAQNQSSLAFTHIAVIDATGAPASADMTVIVTDGRIAALGRTGTVRVPNDAQVVDGTGKVLIPGLWDMHVHWYLKDYLPLFIANGVTGVRQMWGMPIHQEWRHELDKGTLLGPRMVIASAIIDGPNPIWPTSISVTNDAQARDAVRRSKQGGADFIKIYNLLPRDAFFAIANETKKQGLPFAGHIPLSVSAAEASDAGQKSIEHLTGILLASSTREDELRKEQQDAFAKRLPGQRALHPTQGRVFSRRTLETFSAEKAATLFARLQRNHTWQTPTLTVLRSAAFIDDASFRNDRRLKFLPADVTKGWDPTTDFLFKERTTEDFELARLVYKKQVELVGMMRREGLDFLAGTDVLNPYCFPGFSLHDELALLVRAGLTPMEALQSATLNPARFLGKEKDLGTVEKGKIADLVLLDANPLQDISNTQRLAAVVVNGRLLDRAALDVLLVRAEVAASKR